MAHATGLGVARVTGGVAALVWLVAAALAGAVAGVPRAGAADPDDAVSAADFLREAQEPFRQSAWGHFTGSLLHVGERRRHKLDLSLVLRFEPEQLRARIVLGGNQVYGIAQQYRTTPPTVSLELPVQEGEYGLYDFGVDPEDLTFAVLYWQLRREHDPETIRGQACRVFDLAHPNRASWARVWFVRDYRFPVKVLWFEGEEEEPRRTLEFTDFRKQENVWFVEKLILRGKDWKTQIVFAQGELHLDEETPMPDDLLPAASPAPPRDGAPSGP
jgi:hypothetical protein